MSKKSPQYIGFTTAGSQHLSQILFDVKISRYQPEPLEDQLSNLPFFKASVDLSQPYTQLSEATIRHLALPLTDTVDIYLPNNIRLPNIAIQIAPVTTQADCVLGMDFVNTGDIALSSHEGKTVFSYRTPPQGGLDFVAIANEQNKPSAIKRRMAAASRDQPCPCGSGKKHGNCCAKLH